MNTILSIALKCLSSEWAELPALRKAATLSQGELGPVKFSENSGDWGFRDLAEEGLAEVKREPIYHNGHARGERTFYRLKSV